jgi:glutaredoxin
MSKVILYSTTGCPVCERHKALLAEKKAAYEERNTTQNPQYLDELASKGIFAVPTVFVGEQSIQGSPRTRWRSAPGLVPAQVRGRAPALRAGGG